VIDLITAFDGDPIGAVLTDEDIVRLVRDARLISDFDEDSLQPASYDLRLGAEVFLAGETRMLSPENRSCTVASGQFILVTSREELTVPRDVVARAGLISSWAQKGLMSLLSTQIDPGFVGIMVVPILNAGHAPVTLKYCEPIITVEFTRTTRPHPKGWVNLPGNKPQRTIPSSSELKMASPDLTPVTERVAQLESSVLVLEGRKEGYARGMTETLAWLGAGTAIVGLIVALVLALADVI
jgi:dCTP deaminase